MRAAITPVLAISAVIAAAIAPRVFAHAKTTPTPVTTIPVTAAPPQAHTTPSNGNGPTITVQLDRSAVMAGGVLRAELTLQTPESEGIVVERPSDVVLVIDTSGSMSGSKLADAKAAAHSLIEQLGPNDRVAIVPFSTSAWLAHELSPKSHRITQAVANLGASGGTNIAHSLDIARVALPNGGDGRARRVVLLSDGRPDTSNGLSELAGRFASMEAPLTTIGIGADYDPMLLQQLADAGTGNFYWAGPGMALDAIFADEFRSTRNTVAQGTRLTSELGGGATLAGVSGYQIHKNTVALGDLFSGQKRTLYVDIGVPATQGDLDLGALTISWTTPDGQVHQSSVGLGSVQVTTNQQIVAQSLDAQTWERSVVQEEYNDVRTKVSSALARGRSDEAKRILNGYVDNNGMLNAVVGSAAVTANLREAQALEQQIDNQGIEGDALIDLSTKAYQSRRSGQALSY